jgi:hypothetical protein
VKKKIFLILCLLLLTCSTVFAEKQEWVDKSYDFKKVTTVAVLEPLIADDIKNGISEKEIPEIFQDKFKLPNKVKILRLAEIVALIKADTGQDAFEVYKQDKAAGEKLLNDNVSKHADLLITTNVEQYGMTSVYKNGYTYETTEKKTSYINNSNGTSSTVRSPVVREHVVQGGYTDYACAKVRFTVTDTKTNKEVFLRIQRVRKFLCKVQISG